MNKEIKTKAQVEKVLNELMNDLKNAVDCFCSYQVEQRGDDEVVVKSDTTCCILTESAMGGVFKTIECYQMMYKGISWHIDAIQGTERKNIPAIVVTITKSK